MHAALLLKSRLRLAALMPLADTFSSILVLCRAPLFPFSALLEPAIIGFCKGWHRSAHAERAAANESHGYRPAIHVSGTGGSSSQEGRAAGHQPWRKSPPQVSRAMPAGDLLGDEGHAHAAAGRGQRGAGAGVSCLQSVARRAGLEGTGNKTALGSSAAGKQRTSTR